MRRDPKAFEGADADRLDEIPVTFLEDYQYSWAAFTIDVRNQQYHADSGWALYKGEFSVSERGRWVAHRPQLYATYLRDRFTK